MGGVEGGDYGAGGRWVALVAEKLAPWIYESALYSPNEMQHTRFWPRKEFPGKSHLHWDAFILLHAFQNRYGTCMRSCRATFHTPKRLARRGKTR